MGSMTMAPLLISGMSLVIVKALHEAEADKLTVNEKWNRAQNAAVDFPGHPQVQSRTACHRLGRALAATERQHDQSRGQARVFEVGPGETAEYDQQQQLQQAF